MVSSRWSFVLNNESKTWIRNIERWKPFTKHIPNGGEKAKNTVFLKGYLNFINDWEKESCKRKYKWRFVPIQKEDQFSPLLFSCIFRTGYWMKLKVRAHHMILWATKILGNFIKNWKKYMILTFSKFYRDSENGLEVYKFGLDNFFSALTKSAGFTNIFILQCKGFWKKKHKTNKNADW